MKELRRAARRGLLGASLCLTFAACGGGSDAKKPNPGAPASTPKSLDPAGSSDGLAPKKLDPNSRAALRGAAKGMSKGAQRVKDANPHLQMGGSPPPPSAPKKINFDGKTRRDIIDELGYTVPSQWDTQQPANQMRLAQYDLPGEGGGASLVLYRFPGGGGSAAENIARWERQFHGADGGPVKAKVEDRAVGPFKVTRVELAGTFEAPPMMPGGDAGPQADTRMLAAIVEGVGPAYFFKLIGPKATVETWSKSFDDMIASFKKGE